VVFSKELKEKLAAIYPQLKWEFIEKIGGISWYYEKQSRKLGKCWFCKPDGNGATKCEIYDIRPQICRAYGDSEHIFLICPKNSRFDEEQFRTEEILLNLGDSAAWARHDKMTEKVILAR